MIRIPFDPRHPASNAAAVIDRIAAAGGCKVHLPDADASALRELFAQIERFFALGTADKERHCGGNFHFGFRAFGRQYSQQADRPDLNESFTYWADDPATIPQSGEIAAFITALRSVWRIVASVAQALIDEVAMRFASPRRLDIGASSYIETNWYLPGQTRELLQDRHEDGHLFTIMTADGSGLEIERDTGMWPISFEPGELLVMPGSLITAMTGGWLRPLYHQVRNHGLPKRSSILFLANPPMDGSAEVFVVNDANRAIDFTALTRTSGRMFGLPDAPDALCGTAED